MPPPPTPAYPEYEELSKLARQAAAQQRFVNPANLEPEADAVARRGHDWAHAVLGHSYTGARGTYPWESHLLMLADQHGVDPALPESVVARRAAEKAVREAAALAERQWREAADAEWSAIRGAFPVPVQVMHNYQSARHCENGYVQGGDHIIMLEAFEHGRLARLAGMALCTSNSTRNSQYFPQASNIGIAAPQDDSARPTCKKCIRAAAKITGLPADTLLTGPKAGARAGVPNRVFTAKTTRGRRWPR